MDLIRSAIKAIFYDYPIDLLLDSLRNGSTKNNFWDHVTHIISFREHNFSLSELDALKIYISSNEHNQDSKRFDHRDNDVHKAFTLLYNTAKKLLTYKQGNFCIRFEQLFKWRSIVKDIGEDMLIIPFIAHNDIDSKINRTQFIWDNVLGHNNKDLNSILDQGLCDVHSHLGAAIPIFELNWINLMNGIKDVSKQISQLILYTRDLSPKLTTSGNEYSLEHLCVIAAAIRYNLYRYFIDKEDRVNWGDLYNIPTDRIGLNDYKKDLQNKVNVIRSNGIKMRDHHTWDYAINDNEVNSPYVIYSGERRILYAFHKRFAYDPKSLSHIAICVFIYESIKVRFRKEFIHTNTTVGLSNFTLYNERKSSLLNTTLNKIKRTIAIQSSLHRNSADCLEARINFDDINVCCSAQFHKRLFSNGYAIDASDFKNRVSFVTHFIKEKESPKKSGETYSHRYRTMRKSIEYNVKSLGNKINAFSKAGLVGIDSAGHELNCRPEVFGHAYRYYQQVCNDNITYHVGEDFYDIIDGIRAIEEAIVFLEMKNGARLGHCLALGINANTYYIKRHLTSIIPRQILLDNLVWILVKIREYSISAIPSAIIWDLEQKVYSLYSEIGYDIIAPLDIQTYYYSLYLRSDDNYNDSRIDAWAKTSLCKHELAQLARKNNIAVKLNNSYQTDGIIKFKGDNPVIFNYPIRFWEIIDKIQDCMIKDISSSGISIECNPSSNLQIGHIDKYEDHPIFRFQKLDDAYPTINVSINTDDKGIFATSIANEFSLIGLAITKMKNSDGENIYNQETMLKFVSRIIENNKKQRFTI